MVGDIYIVDGEYYAVQWNRGSRETPKSYAIIAKDITEYDIPIPYGVVGPFEGGLLLGLRFLAKRTPSDVFQHVGKIDIRYLSIFRCAWVGPHFEALNRHNRNHLSNYVNNFYTRMCRDTGRKAIRSARV